MIGLEIRDLEIYQLCLSGYYGSKIAKNFSEFHKGIQNTFIKYKKILEVDGCEIYLTEENILEFYGFFDLIYKDEYLKKINAYLKKTIYKVKEEQLREKIIEIANLDLSRNSRYHIFNIEILVTCALRKPDYFFFIQNLVKEKYLYLEESEIYEFLIFSIFDAETKEKASFIYETIMENAANTYELYNRNRMYDLKSVANDINSEEVQEKVFNNLELIKI